MAVFTNESRRELSRRSVQIEILPMNLNPAIPSVASISSSRPPQSLFIMRNVLDKYFPWTLWDYCERYFLTCSSLDENNRVTLCIVVEDVAHTVPAAFQDLGITLVVSIQGLCRAVIAIAHCVVA